MVAPSMTTAESAGQVGHDTVQTVYNLAALEAYRAKNVFRAVADVKWAGGPGGSPMPGNPVTFTKISAMSPATTPLSETTEPTAVSIADTQVSITLVEYGNATKRTKKLNLTSFLRLETEVPREVAANMEESVDLVARDVLVAGSNVLYGGDATSRITLDLGTTDDLLTGANAARARAFLAGKNAPPPPESQDYVAFIHPDVAYDFMLETGAGAWSSPHIYSDPANIYSGEIGRIHGIRFVENANCKIWANAGSGSPGGLLDVYATIFVGQQALGEAVGEGQHMVIAGPFDDLQRFVSVGWYGLLGYSRVREDSLLRYETLSSIGANT